MKTPLTDDRIVTFDGVDYVHIANVRDDFTGKKAKDSDIVSSDFAWVDIDPPKDISQSEFELWRTETREKIEMLSAQWIYDSGRGFWLFWQLDEVVSADRCRELNLAAAAYVEHKTGLKVDACHDPSRICKPVGTNNRKTGRRSIWILENFLEGAIGADELEMMAPVADNVSESSPALPAIAGSPGIPRSVEKAKAGDPPTDRSEALWGLVHDMKRAGFTIDQTTEVLEPITSAWPHATERAKDDDYSGKRLVSQIERIWAKAPEFVPSLELERGRAPDTHLNAMAAIAHTSLHPRYNELKQAVEFSEVSWDAARYGTTLNDKTLLLVLTAVHQRFSEHHYRPSKESLFDAIKTAAFSRSYNPVVEYLESLTWDGTERIDGLFVNYFAAEDDIEGLNREFSRLFMLGAVARALRPGCDRDEMPVLRGGQGKGKSKGLRALFGADLFSDAALGRLSGKDAAMSLQGVWLHEFAELDDMRRSDVTELKAFMSRAVDRFRPPYGKAPEEIPRRCVFAGTCNEGGYLMDGTGNRRYWPITVSGDVDIEGLKRDRDQLWAEAYALFLDGADWRLSEEWWSAATDRQAEETTEDPWEDIIKLHLTERLKLDDEDEFAEPELPSDRITSAELMDHICRGDVSRQSRRNAQRVKTIMTQRLGWTHSKSVRTPSWPQGAGYKLEKRGVNN